MISQTMDAHQESKDILQLISVCITQAKAMKMP